MIPGPSLQGSFRDPGVHCLSQLWLGTHLQSALSGCGGLGPGHVFLKCARRVSRAARLQVTDTGTWSAEVPASAPCAHGRGQAGLLPGLRLLRPDSHSWGLQSFLRWLGPEAPASLIPFQHFPGFLSHLKREAGRWQSPGHADFNL